mmetsp:Transcript_7798/g.27783  ORF Transcript_7798/g.27783 Transcript_7798/m.27783 type:complete len:200 (-) Transcript_7798:411-1010(-)
MTKPKELLFPQLHSFQECRNLVQRSNSFQHTQNGFVCAPMQRSIQSTDRSRQTRVHIRATGSNVPCSSRGTIHFMFCMQDHHHIQCLGNSLVRSVIPSPTVRVNHIQEILCVGEIAPRWCRCSTSAAVISCCCECSCLPKRADNLLGTKDAILVHPLSSNSRIRFRMKSTQHGHPCYHNHHRVYIHGQLIDGVGHWQWQ